MQLAGTNGANPVVSVLMSSWGCEDGGGTTCVTTPGATFSHPITLNVYTRGVGDAAGALIATQTKTFAIPYRPSAEPLCSGGSAWSPDGGVTCFNGFATKITFDALSVPIPDDVVVTVAYNTTHHGYAPIGESAPCYTESGGCGYDSLNVGLRGAVTLGAQPRPSTRTSTARGRGAYCDAGVGGSGALRLDTGCWATFQPNFEVEATATTRRRSGRQGRPVAPARRAQQEQPGPTGATGAKGDPGAAAPTSVSPASVPLARPHLGCADRKGKLRVQVTCPVSAGHCEGRARAWLQGVLFPTVLFDAKGGRTVRVDDPAAGVAEEAPLGQGRQPDPDRPRPDRRGAADGAQALEGRESFTGALLSGS